MKSAIGFLLLLLAAQVWAGDIYRWVDEKGVIRYSDQKPPAGTAGVELFHAAPTVPPSAAPAAEPAQAPAKPALVLYSFDDCGAPCKNAEDLLQKSGLNFSLKNTNADKIELQKLTGKLEVPVLVIGDAEAIIGFDAKRWGSELEKAGAAVEVKSERPD